MNLFDLDFSCDSAGESLCGTLTGVIKNCIQDFMGKRKRSARKPGGGARQKVPLGEEVESISYMMLTYRMTRHHFHLSVLPSRQVGYG